MRVLVAGAWDRRGLNAATLLVAMLAVAAAVLGPMYARASAEHLIDSRIDARAPYLTGLSYSVQAMPGHPPRDTPAAYHPPRPRTLLARAERLERGPGVGRYWRPPVRWVLDRGGLLTFGVNQFATPLYWRAGMCRMAEVRGRCPRAPGEVLVQATMARRLGVGPGGRVPLTFTDRFVATVPTPNGTVDLEKERRHQRVFRVVGTYRIADPESPRWFDLGRFSGLERLVPPPPSMRRTGDPSHPAHPPAPALLTVPATITSQTFEAGVDRPVDTAAVNLASLRDTQRAADAFQRRALAAGTADDDSQLDLRSVFAEVRGEHVRLDRVVTAALAPLLVLAVLLLHALVTAGAEVRRPSVSLARLRGHRRGQVLRFAVAEPLLVVATATVLGLLVAVAAAHVVARGWLHPGIPVRVDLLAWVCLATVAGAAAGTCLLAARAVVREPLADALRAGAARRTSSRAVLVLRSAVVALAVAAVVQLVTSPHQSSQLLALLAPLFVALAVSVLGAVLLRRAGGSWVAHTARSGSPAAFLAARRLVRRPDLVRLMVPLLLATSLVGFAVSASAVSDAWRVSRARALVGAPVAYGADTSPGRLLRVTHAVDPSGEYLAAAMVDDTGDGSSRRVFVDARRLPAVAAWDPAWSDVPVAELAHRLTAGVGRPLTFRGLRLTVRLADVRLRSATGSRPELWLQYVDRAGESRDVRLGRLRDTPRARLSSPVHGCRRGCTVTQLYVSGEALSVTDVNGSLTVRSVSVDDRVVDWGLRRRGAWRPARPFPVSLVDPPVVPRPRPDGLHLSVYLGQLPSGRDATPTMVAGYGRITPGATPDTPGVVVTDATATTPADRPGGGTALRYGPDVVTGVGVSGAQAPMRLVARVHALPLVGDEGELADLGTSLVEYQPPAGAVVAVRLWTAGDTPPAMLARVRAAGVPLTRLGSVDERLTRLRGDAFSLGLRLFLLIALATVLVAAFGVLASAVLQSRWVAYEAAALRVVGVRQRSLARASLLEHVTTLGCAVLLGLASAVLSLRLVLPSLSLGPAAPHEPAPLYPVPWSALLVAGGLVLGVAVLVAGLVARRTARLGRPSTLRGVEAG